MWCTYLYFFFFFQAEDGIRDLTVTWSSDVCSSDLIPCSTTPLAVAGGRSFSSLAGGWGESCALQKSDAAAYCWGDNTYGALGNGSTANSRTPVAVSGGRGLVGGGPGKIFACRPPPGSAPDLWGN